MSGVHTETVESVHAYTRSNVPWELNENRGAHGESVSGRKFGWRLFHYISSGGMQTFGRTVAQMEHTRRQRRFIAFVILFVVAWVVLYIV